MPAGQNRVIFMQQVTIIGHRGASGHLENTIPSFELALEQGADGFELDVRESGDGQLVVVHDSVVGSHAVKSSPYKVFCDTEDGSRIPLLEDVLKQFGGKTFLDIELKETGFEQKAIDLIKKYSNETKVLISGFDCDMLNKVHELSPHIELGFIYNRTQDEESRHNSPIDYVIPQFRLASRELISEIHEEDLQVYAWTVNEVSEMERLISLGVDGIITDEPALLAKLLGR